MAITPPHAVERWGWTTATKKPGTIADKSSTKAPATLARLCSKSSGALLHTDRETMINARPSPIIWGPASAGST